MSVEIFILAEECPFIGRCLGTKQRVTCQIILSRLIFSLLLPGNDVLLTNKFPFLLRKTKVYYCVHTSPRLPNSISLNPIKIKSTHTFPEWCLIKIFLRISYFSCQQHRPSLIILTIFCETYKSCRPSLNFLESPETSTLINPNYIH